jgi:hypothetical protein
MQRLEVSCAVRHIYIYIYIYVIYIYIYVVSRLRVKLRSAAGDDGIRLDLC